LQSSVQMTKQEFQKKLGAQIAKLRKEKNLSQIEFADLLDREKQNINRLEHGRTNPSSWLVFEISEALEIHPNQIFDFISKKK